MKYHIAFFAAVCAVAVSVPAYAREMETRHGDEMRPGKAGMEMGSSTMHMRKGAKMDLTADQVACVKTAVGVREGAVGSAFTTFSSSVSSALSARASALATAWGYASTTERGPAIRTAWKTYSESIRMARQTLRETKKTVWGTFKDSVKACKVEPGATGDNPGQDQQ
jgi:hypothetical protein